MVFVNKRIFDKLAADTQNVILIAAANAEKKGWELGRENAVKDTNTLRENGMVVTEPSSTLEDELREIGKTMVAEWLAESGEVGQSIVDQYKK
jgi:TRAP-type C4-dicarboxylate transport system substrate-binding protein